MLPDENLCRVGCSSGRILAGSWQAGQQLQARIVRWQLTNSRSRLQHCLNPPTWRRRLSASDYTLGPGLFTHVHPIRVLYGTILGHFEATGYSKRTEVLLPHPPTYLEASASTTASGDWFISASWGRVTKSVCGEPMVHSLFPMVMDCALSCEIALHGRLARD